MRFYAGIQLIRTATTSLALKRLPTRKARQRR